MIRRISLSLTFLGALVAGCGGGGEEELASTYFGDALSGEDFIGGLGTGAGGGVPGEDAGGGVSYEVDAGTGGGTEDEPGSTDDASVEEPEPGLCTDGTFACQNGKVMQCSAGEWLEVMACANPLDCNSGQGNCSGACVPNCNGKECGDDGCGTSCGKCGVGESCESGLCDSGEPVEPGEGGTPVEGGGEEGGGVTSGGSCVPSGTGKTVGKLSKNIAWQDSTGEFVELHSMCGSELVILIETASW